MGTDFVVFMFYMIQKQHKKVWVFSDKQYCSIHCSFKSLLDNEAVCIICGMNGLKSALRQCSAQEVNETLFILPAGEKCVLSIAKGHVTGEAQFNSPV